MFRLNHIFTIVEAEPLGRRRRWVTSIDGYEHYLLDHYHTELPTYRWHPGPDFLGPDHPHLHVSATLNARTSATSEGQIDLDRLHVATGHVSFAAIVRMLIQEFGIAPLRHDWQQILDRVEPIL